MRQLPRGTLNVTPPVTAGDIHEEKRNRPTLQRHIMKWLSLSGAAEYLDVSNDTISRRAVPWQDDPVPWRVRWKLLKLGEGTRQERRYCVEDLEALLVSR